MMPEYYRDELEALTESEFYEQSGVFEHSIVVPLRFMQYLSGVRLNGIPRADSGFLFRRTDIETIRLYVDHARLLPTVLENVKRLYPPAAVGLEGLEPEKVVGFHQQVLAHAHTWTHLEHAVKVAVRLNDHYSIDGGDPNGYVGILWSIAGLHDRPWFEREIYGKIRYMTDKGIAKKYDVNDYKAEWNRA